MLLILEAVGECHGNKKAAAALLGMSYNALKLRYGRYNRACDKAIEKWERTSAMVDRSHR